MKTRGTRYVVLLAAALSGCIFVQNDDPPAGTATSCRFNGDRTSACGMCIANHCQNSVNACCVDPICEGFLGSLDSCSGSADTSACSELASTTGILGVTSALGSCIQSRCSGCVNPADSFDGGNGRDGSSSSGTTTCDTLSSAGECLCSSVASGGNAVPCKVGMVAPGLCCADFGYPRPGFTCSCQTFSCAPSGSNGDWTCSLGSMSTGTTSASGPCCVTGSSCYCSSSSSTCGSNAPVDPCTVASIGCGGGQHAVPSCSL